MTTKSESFTEKDGNEMRSPSIVKLFGRQAQPRSRKEL